MEKTLKELTELLNNLGDAYFDFVTAIVHYARKKPARAEKVLRFLKDNPGVTSSDVVRFVSEQPDFSEDAAYNKVS